jgi:tetratricopeptide (TPR) repeat protein
MTRGSFGHRAMSAVAVVIAMALAAPVLAQSTGMVKGKVVDAKGQPVEAAKITIEFTEGVSRKLETKTNKKGEFVQIGLMPGGYKVTAQKEGIGAQSFDTRVRLGQTAEVNFALNPATAMPTKEEIAKMQAVKKSFDEGVAASRAGDHDTAIAKFTEAAASMPTCADCYYNIGYAHAQKKEYDKAEAAFKKALEIKPGYAEAYNGLANIYNAQKKFDLAAQASAEAAKASGAAGGAGNADATFNQGVILWNGGKVAEAKAQFEETVKLNPNHAEAHYWLGMATLNEGKMPEAATQFEKYLELAPTGQYADQAKGILSQIKK